MARLLLAAALLLLAGCSPGQKSKTDPVIGQAFVGPITLNLREEVHPKSKTVAAVKHGEKLDIIQVRRRFVRLRTPAGVEGWTDSRNLLSTEQMESLAALAKYASKLKSQGEATVYEPLNVHTEPSRPSTSFYQITEGVKVDVVGHKLAPRTASAPKSNLQISKPAPPPRARKPRKEPKVPPVPRPAAPSVPADWQELSRTELPEPPEPQKAEPEKPNVPMEDWSLVRTKDGKAGWVLTRNLVMAIPDEVAQYSEGARITSYFALGDVPDGDQTKHHWIWTTIRGNAQPYHFDSFRIFIYMLRRHRYETAYIERNVEGYYPVEVSREGTPRFSLILREKDGSLHRKTYQLEGYVVRKIADEIYKGPVAGDAPSPGQGLPGAGDADHAPEETKPSLFDRMKKLFKTPPAS
jgi:hypothetical protein